MKNRYYSPRIARQLVTWLYHEAKARRIPMTVLVNQLITDGLEQSAITQHAAVDPGRSAFNHRITHPGVMDVDPARSPIPPMCVNETNIETHTYAHHP